MAELLQKSLPFLVPAMWPVLVLLLAPLSRRRVRTFLAFVTGVLAVGLLVDVVVLEHGYPLELEVPTVFGRGDPPELFVWAAEVVTAPAWHWHIVAAIYCGIAALWSFVGRNRPPMAPGPVLSAVLLFLFVLVVRIAMEKAAAPVGVVWALGTSSAGFLISLFFGFYCGARGYSFGNFVKSLAIANLLQRVVLVVIAWFATSNHYGTHLDVNVVSELSPPLLGEITIENATQGWLYCILLPQMTFALVMSIVVGIVLGALPFLLGRRRAL